MRASPHVFLLLVAGLSTVAEGQEGVVQYPLPADVQSLDGIIRAYYEVVSGPAAESADRARDESLHTPGARVGISRLEPGGKPALQMMTLDEFHDRVGAPRSKPFYEWEIHRVTQQFGTIAHVWSTYVVSDAPDGTPTGRGINSIQLYFDGTRWWITGWIFDVERAGSSIPRQFLPAGG